MTELELLRERIDTLEHFRRRSRRAFFCLVWLPIAYVAVAGQARGPAPVRGSALELVDSSNRVRAKLFMQDNSPRLEMLDTGGKRRLTMQMESDGALISLVATDGSQLNMGTSSTTSGANINAVRSGSVAGAQIKMDYVISPGFAGFYSGDKLINIVPKDSRIEVKDADGFETHLGSTELQSPTTGTETRTSAAALTMFDKDKKVIWSVPAR